MPYASKSQQGYFHTHVKRLGKKVVDEFDAASKGQHGLPDHVSSKKPSLSEARMAWKAKRKK